MSGPTSTPAAPADGIRRADLDALRSAAMLLGIVVHASLAYFPYPWPVQDPHQERSLGLLYAAIHGFRMPLFFLLSGFFTMLVLRRRGRRRLLEQRSLRILLPLLLASATILPLDRAAISWAVRRSVAATAAPSGLTPLALAAMAGDVATVSALLDAGAPVGAKGRFGSTPLHTAAFMGHGDVVELLLARGADPEATNAFGTTPLGSLVTPPGVAVLTGEFLGLPGRSAADLESGRRRVRDLLAPLAANAARPTPLESVIMRYRALLASPALSVGVGGRSWQLFETDVFDHLWFLWYLCWLVAAFALADWFGRAPAGKRRWWLIPASCLPYAFMWSPYGPDTALGILPTPHLLFFYGCFFWFGAATYAGDGPDTPLGARWPIVLPLTLLVLFPAGIATLADRSLAALLQPAYAWGMSIGLIGLFRRCFPRPSAGLRWLADGCYWMYLAHLPLVIACQSLLCDLAWPVVGKFLAVIAVSVAVLLVTYRWCVRYTLVGWLLNGPRSPPSTAGLLRRVPLSGE